AADNIHGSINDARYSPHDSSQHTNTGTAALEYNISQFKQESDTIQPESTSHVPSNSNQTPEHMEPRRDQTAILKTESEKYEKENIARKDSNTVQPVSQAQHDRIQNKMPQEMDALDFADGKTEKISAEDKKKTLYDSESHIISYAAEQPVLKYRDVPVAYISRNEEFKETWAQEDIKPVSAETHDPVQMSNLYHTLSESPEGIKSGQYALHLTNGEKIAVTRETVHAITKSENLPETEDDLVSLEKAAYVDAKGCRTRIFGISGMEEFAASSIGKQRINKNSAKMAVQGKDRGKKVPEEHDLTQQNHTEQENADLFCIRKKKKINKDAFAEMGLMAFRQSFGSVNAYSGYRTVKRYAGWVDPVVTGMIKKAELKAAENVFRVNNELGNIDHSLRETGIKTNVLKNKKGKYKKRLSDQEVQYLMNELRAKFKAANLGSVDLKNMKDGELKNLIKKLSGKDKEIVKCYAELKNIAGLRKNQISLIKRTRKLLRLFSNALEGADFYEGMALALRYAGLTGRMVKYGRAAKKWVRDKTGKVVKPYGRYIDKRTARKELKANARVERRLQKKMSRQVKRQARRAENINRISIRFMGKDITQLKSSFQLTKVGKGIGKIKGKLSPVMKIQKHTAGAVSKIFGKTFNFIGKIFSAPRRLAMWALGFIAPVFIILVLITVGAAAILSALDIIPDSDSVMDNGNTVVANAADECMEKDNGWYREIMGLENNTTPKEANGGNAVMGGYDPLTGTQYEITEFSGEPVYKYYDGRAFPYIAGKDGKTLDKNALSLFPQINLYSNAKAVMSAAAVYRQEIDISDQGYVDFCKQLWEHSHAYQSSIGDIYMCSGCKHANIACFKKTEYNAYTNAYGENYNFLPGISDTAAAAGCYTFYCNDASSYNTAVHKKESVSATFGDSDKGCETKEYESQYTIYCGFSRHASDNPGIEDCSGVSDSIKNAYHAHGFYRDVETEGCGSHGTAYNNCEFAKDFHIGDGIDSTSLSNACAGYQIALVKNGSTKQEVAYGGHSYWMGYCSNLGDLGAGENYDGYILVSKSNANLSVDGNYVINPYLSGDKP
ncbi:MAG: hypothetical protein NC489_45485, partial [Ruminococcus flavefaciens]|nr:hypothetical protein [Ruminococcus flavefaciens]